MKPNLFDVLKSNLIEHKIIASQRESEINREELKAHKIPPFFKILIIAFIMAIMIVVGIPLLLRTQENQQVFWILTIQTGIIGIQLWVMYAQTRNDKMQNLPEFIIEKVLRKVTTTKIENRFEHLMESPHENKNINRDITEIYLKNIGQTAHQVSFKIKTTKRGEKLCIDKSKLHPLLYTFIKEEKKLACELKHTEYINKKIRIDLEYFDKRGRYCEAKFIKLAGEQDFIPMFTGLE